MHSTDVRPSWTNRLSTAFTWTLVVSVMGLMTLSCFWLSGFPQYGLLSLWGRTAQAEIVESDQVHYASFPYDGVVHTVAFETQAGEARTYELTGEYIPPSLSGVFEVSYLPSWPLVVQATEERRLSLVFLAGGCLVTLFSILFFGLFPQSEADKSLLLRIARWPGAKLITVLERLWHRLGIDESRAG